MKIERLRDTFSENNLDGILLTNTYNRRYMTNFTGSSGVVLISKEKALFITDFRYIEQATEQAADYEIVKHTGPIHEEVAKQVKNLGINKLGFEKNDMSYSAYETYRDVLEAELVPVSGLVEKLRLIKTDSEIKILKEAAQIADAAFEHILDSFSRVY